MNKKIFGKNLKEARKKVNKTQEQVADEMNISRTNISKYENGDLEPNLETLIKMAEIYKISIDCILGISNKKDEILTKEEKYLLEIYKDLSPRNKIKLELLAEQIQEEQIKNKEKIS